MTTLILYATLFGALLGAVSGRVYTHFVADAEGGILPTWLFAGIMAAIMTFLVSIMLSIAFKNSIETHFIKLMVIAAITSELLLVGIMYKSVQHK